MNCCWTGCQKSATHAIHDDRGSTFSCLIHLSDLLGDHDSVEELES